MKTNRFVIERLDPVNGRVMEIQPFGQRSPVTGPMAYEDCREFLQQHKDMKLVIYRMAKISDRKNAKRHLDTNIYAEDLGNALYYFSQRCILHDTTYQLLTGDWQLIAEKKPGESHYTLYKEA